MATLTIKNLPDELYARLKTRAAAHRRSLNRKAIVCLEAAVAETGPEAEAALLKDLGALREQAGIYLTDAFLREAIDEGRLCSIRNINDGLLFVGKVVRVHPLDIESLLQGYTKVIADHEASQLEAVDER